MKKLVTIICAISSLNVMAFGRFSNQRILQQNRSALQEEIQVRKNCKQNISYNIRVLAEEAEAQVELLEQDVELNEASTSDLVLVKRISAPLSASRTSGNLVICEYEVDQISNGVSLKHAVDTKFECRNPVSLGDNQYNCTSVRQRSMPTVRERERSQVPDYINGRARNVTRRYR